ncbi:MAG: alcohol dehydrogenase catalytic domain-containing protein [Chloroflexi bacterium]|nr:alcohol dehydrogenase catalytic domain-containing protein [Chloroflexota bacterium]
MRAIATRPGSGRAWVVDVAEPELANADDVLVEMLRVGVCGTDRHVMEFPPRNERALPAGDDFLILGHEAVGRVSQTGSGVSSLQVGDFVVPTVRRGCGECAACAVNQADLCFTGRVRERGIVGLHGFLAERIVEREKHLLRIPADLDHVAPLVESLCTPEKALRRIDNARAHLPVDGTLHGVSRALVTGSGPIALLAVMALRLRGVATWILARQPASGPAARLVEDCGATYVPLQSVELDHPQAALGVFDAVIEATGAAELSVAMLDVLAPNGVLDLVGGPPERKPVPIQASALGGMVGRNLTILGSVNANMDDWRMAVQDLMTMRRAFPGGVEALITHRYAMRDVELAFERRPGQIKALIEIAEK